jgi:hypothetical protein
MRNYFPSEVSERRDDYRNNNNQNPNRNLTQSLSTALYRLHRHQKTSIACRNQQAHQVEGSSSVLVFRNVFSNSLIVRNLDQRPRCSSLFIISFFTVSYHFFRKFFSRHFQLIGLRALWKTSLVTLTQY